MPLRPATRIPRRFNRPVSRVTRRLMERRHRTPFRSRAAGQWRRWSRAIGRGAGSWRRAIFRWSLVTLVALLLLAGGIVVLSPIGRIQEVRVTRTDPRLDIEEVLHLLSPLFGRSLVTVSGREVRALLEAEIGAVRSVAIGKHYPSQLLVRIELDPLVARVRIVAPEENALTLSASGGDVGALTDHGVYEVVPGWNDTTLPLLFVVDWGARPQPAAAPLFSTEFLSRMEEAVGLLQSQFGQEARRRIVYVRAQEFHLTVNGASLWFDMRTPLAEQLLRYRTFLRSVGLDNAKQYVDLRLADRVVYR